MSSYITNTRPSILKQILHLLGIIDLPVKVNCWFCNQDSFLLPGTRNTPDHWNCHLCDNTNARDPKTGDILDPSPFHTSQEPQKTTIKRSTNHNTSRNNNRSICDSCIQNQALMYDILSNYIPDERDPSYQERCDNVDNEKRRLQHMYKLCDPCQSLVDMVVREQMEILNVRSIVRTFSSSVELVTPLPSKPSTLLYTTQKTIWFFSHFLIILFALNELYRPTSWDISEFILDIKELYSVLLSMNIYNTTLEDATHMLYDIVNALFQWTTTNIIIFWIILNIISLRGLYVHPLVSRDEVDEVLNWSIYKTCQNILLFTRFVIISLIILQRDFTVILCFYFVVLIASLFTVKINRPKVKIRNIGSSTSKSFLEEEEHQSMIDDEVSIMDIDEPLSVVNNDDGLESLVFRLQSL